MLGFHTKHTTRMVTNAAGHWNRYTPGKPGSVTLGRWAALEPSRLPTVLAAFGAPWWVTGGVAIELFCGHRIRDNLDIDVEILRGDAAHLHAALPGWELHSAHRGRLTAWTPDLPLQANSLWARPDPDAPWAVQFLLAATTSTINGIRRWAYRRDPRITYDLAQVGWSPHDACGVSVQQPELVLLFKAAAPVLKTITTWPRPPSFSPTTNGHGYATPSGSRIPTAGGADSSSHSRDILPTTRPRMRGARPRPARQLRTFDYTSPPVIWRSRRYVSA